MLRSLKSQLLSYFFIANILILLSFSFFIYTTAQKGVLDQLDSKLEAFSMDAIEHILYKNHYDAKKIEKLLSKEFRKIIYAKIICFNIQKNTLEHDSKSIIFKDNLFSIPLHEKSKLNDIYYFNKGKYRVSSMLIIKEKNVNTFLQLATKKVESSPHLEKLKYNLFISIPIILFLLLFIVNLLINKTFKPMKEVIKSVNSISSNNLSSRVSSEQIPTEIQALVKTFNKLLNNIEESFTRISTFSSDASHELKTPLTVMRGEIEVALRKTRDAQEYKYVLENVLDEIVSIQEIIDQLFLLSKKDTSELKHSLSEVYFDELISDVILNLSALAKKKNIQIIFEDVIPLSVFVNESLLKIAISNLLRNALIYSHNNSKIDISFSKNSQVYVLKIQDYGCGISKQDLPYIFDRFYRADKARTKEKSGTGLGLCIVKMILDIYFYDIEVISEIGLGTTTLVKLNMNKN